MTVFELSKKYKWNIPTVCPACGANLDVDSSGRLFCPRPDCKQKVVHNIMKLSNKWSILELGPRIVEDFVEGAKIKSLAQFIKDIDSPVLDEIAGKNAIKIRKNLKDAINTTRTTANFIAAFDIEGYGERKVHTLIDAGYDLNGLFEKANPRDISNIRGWSLESGIEFLRGLNDLKDDVLSVAKLCKISDKKEVVEGGKLSGLSFCFTGAMDYKRSDLEKMVVDNGGTFSSVNKTLSYLVQADPNSTSSKSEKAKKFGTKIISPEEFLAMIK